jgi:hypothetical protein
MQFCSFAVRYLLTAALQHCSTAARQHLVY